MVPIIPAIPRSLEKRKFKEDVKSSEDGGGIGSPNRPTSLSGEKDSQVETAVPQTQAVPNGALNRQNETDALQESVVQEAAIEAIENAGSEGEIASAEGKSTFQSTQNEQKPTMVADSIRLTPAHVQDFGIEKNGFRLPPPFCPKISPPLVIPTDVSSANEKAFTLEQTSQGVEDESESNVSQQASVGNHVVLNAAAPTFHAHPTPPTDANASPNESSYKEYDTAQAAHLQQGPTPPIDDPISPIQLSFQGYDSRQNISFYAEPQSSNDPSSPNHSVYQGYAYAPASYAYSPESQASHHHYDVPHRTEVGVSYEQHYEPQQPCYSDPSTHTLLGSQPPLTPSRTPLDPSAQPWSYPNGPVPTVPLSYDYVPSHHPQPAFEPHVRSASQGTIKSGESAGKDELIEDGPEPVQVPASDKGVAQIFRCAWRNLNDSLSSHVPLVEFLIQQFNVEEYADCELTLSHEECRFETTVWSLSSLLLAQSRKLRDLLKSASLNKEGKISLEIRLADRFVTPWAMNSALRTLYGERPETFVLSIVHGTFEPNIDTWGFSMDACLAFAAAGHVLGLDSVVLKGLHTASSILDWDTLEHALSFGLESGANQGTGISVDVIPLSAYSPVLSRGGDSSSATNLSPPSASTDSGPEHSKNGVMSSVSSHMSEVRSALDLQTCCLQWLAFNLDDSWDFDSSARPLAEVDRLPATAESRSPLSKSRLSQIQFGDHPSELHAKASDRNVLVSSIVLSLPFMALRYLLKLGSRPLLRQVHAIVKERERRRQIVLQSKSVPWSQRLAAREYEWAEVGYTEWVETSDDGKVALARSFTGIDRQVSEPSTPGRQRK